MMAIMALKEGGSSWLSRCQDWEQLIIWVREALLTPTTLVVVVVIVAALLSLSVLMRRKRQRA
jgi:hypothetical protein